MSRSSWKVCGCGGVVVVGWLRPSLGFSFSQAEQNDGIPWSSVFRTILRYISSSNSDNYWTFPLFLRRCPSRSPNRIWYEQAGADLGQAQARLLNGYTYSFETSGLFLNVKNQNFEKIWIMIFYPQPLQRGVLKKWKFLKLVIQPKLLNMIYRTHKKRNKSKIWALYLKNWASYGNFCESR